MRIAAVLLLALSLTGPAQAGGFSVGVVNPTPVPAADSAALGSTVQRYDLRWNGEQRFTDALVMASDTRPVVSVSPSAPSYTAATATRFCAWVGSMLDRYPRVQDVIVGNEPPVGQRVGYVAILRACSPVVRAHGARVIGPGLHPAGPVSYLWPLVDAIAKAGAHLLDALDFHPYWYSGVPYDTAIVRHARAVFGWAIPVWITEDGMQSKPPPQFAGLYSGAENAQFVPSEGVQAQHEAMMMRDAKCSGVAVWMTFLLRDQPELKWWQSGVERPDGSRKPAYYAYAAMSREIAAGHVHCSTAPPPAPPTSRWTADERRAQKLGEIGGWARDAYVGR